ncbi:MAG: DUF2815 family protein [Muribaculaceae bacterium]|nr:DUF2815 family protein [Muribaculaceae bacterium]
MIKNKQFKPQKKGDRLFIRARLSYVHLDAPWAGNEGADKKYSVSCIVPKDDKETITFLEKEIEAAKAEGKTKKWGGVIPKKLSLPLRDGDEEKEDEAYKNSMFFSASSQQPVKTFDRGTQECEPSKIYSGCWGIVSLKLFPYDAAGNKGIGAGLNQVMFWADDDTLGGASQGNDFEDIEGIDMDGEDLDDL